MERDLYIEPFSFNAKLRQSYKQNSQQKRDATSKERVKLDVKVWGGKFYVNIKRLEDN